jgi:hypothetical protein
MKKIVLGFVCLLIASTSVFSQAQIRENQVPPAVKEDFAQRFQTAENITWLQEGADYYGARYQIEGRNGEVVYLPDGQWVQSSEEIAYLNMPDDARQYCRENYPDFSAHEVKKLSTRKYGILFKIKIRKELQQVTMTFDMKGKLIEETEESLEVEKEKKSNRGLKGKLNGLLKK